MKGSIPLCEISAHLEKLLNAGSKVYYFCVVYEYWIIKITQASTWPVDGYYYLESMISP